ncbi:hypothetical protein Pmar_PMAR027165, partial [Perkinsus marinus ATCC 50983]
APRLRLQLMGKKGRRFYRMVACNQKDPRNGKHMEVLLGNRGKNWGISENFGK